MNSYMKCTLQILILFIFSDLSEREKASVSETLATARAHSATIQNLKRDHSEQSACIEQCATDTFSQKYMVCPISFLTPSFVI